MGVVEQLMSMAYGSCDTTYYVMNKDKALISFVWKSINSSITIPVNVKVIDDSTPSFIKDRLKAWLESRTPPKHRAFMKELLEISGMRSTRDIINFSKGLSLIDTFWVTSDLSVKWSDVNLFDNEFDEAISKIAFTGGLGGLRIKTTSPEFGTDGMLPKCWVRESDGVIYLKKGGTEGASNAGREPYSEVLASQVLDVLGYNHITYTLEMFRGRLVSSCPLITSKEVCMTPIHTLCNIEDLFTIISFCDSYGFADDLYRMLIFDYLSLNSDRHGSNFAVLFNSDDYSLLGMAPIYDNGVGMLNYYTIGRDFDDYKVNYVPALYDSFEAIAEYSKKMLKSKHNVNRLVNFKFDRSAVPGYPDDKIDFIEHFLQDRVREFLSW